MENVALSFLTDQQARQLFRQELEKFITDHSIGAKPGESHAKVVDLDGLIQARPFIGSRSTIYKKVSRGEIPHSKSGKRLIFDLNTIDDWLLSNKVKTPAEIEVETKRYLDGRNKKRSRIAPLQ
ncbi:MAG: helix-turn-helix domain-containing protein [Phaeodactylibacter sp.]|nr:helix-turn-helix domain-containing protein [Phaeodactylibacter sp.]MCB9299936.1 helix-turn-helix domain-containing protein [Lewinellaceae bacterium]